MADDTEVYLTRWPVGKTGGETGGITSHTSSLARGDRGQFLGCGLGRMHRFRDWGQRGQAAGGMEEYLLGCPLEWPTIEQEGRGTQDTCVSSGSRKSKGSL
ncbi:hypothetical protein BY996DRAFT_6486285 [Phakopsora pachyrhizi]|nr:hypothetical protein BY996DRAFT_6486285 [Phakopsora pachyrhizi]